MIEKKNIPKHIAIIMDGNGRWAQERGLTRTSGHRQGIKRVKEVIKEASGLGVKFITLFAFSSENWSRPKREISLLMRYLGSFLDREVKEMHKNNIRFLTIGQDKPLPEYILRKIKEAQAKTENNSGLTVVLALNYGSRQEIVDAAKKFSQEVVSGQAKIEDLDTKMFGRYLYTEKLPDPDLLIRTSSELRLSNFLLWQLSYAEFYFPKKCWPDFGAADLREAIQEYQNRQRRFGGL